MGKRRPDRRRSTARQDRTRWLTGAVLRHGIIHFDTLDSLRAALNGEHASEVIGDIRNFTDVQPVIQINERFVPEI